MMRFTRPTLAFSIFLIALLAAAPLTSHAEMILWDDVLKAAEKSFQLLAGGRPTPEGARAPRALISSRDLFRRSSSLKCRGKQLGLTPLPS